MDLITWNWTWPIAGNAPVESTEPKDTSQQTLVIAVPKTTLLCSTTKPYQTLGLVRNCIC